MSTSSAATPRRRTGRRILVVVLAVLLALVLAALLAVWRLGPSYGIYLLPPSPQQYAQTALQRMDAGYYATGPQWDDARRHALDATADATEYTDTYPALTEALGVAGGKHSFFQNPDEAAEPADNATPTVETAGGITTVTVPAVTSDGPEADQAIGDDLAGKVTGAAPATTCGWIVDLRGNTGGTMYPMLAGLSSLLPDGPLVGFQDRAGTSTDVELRGGAVSMGGQDVLSVADPAKTDRSIAVLQDSMTASSGEVTLLAFRGLPNATSFGEPSAGYSSANQPVGLYDGALFQLTTSLDVDRNGRVYGDVVEPEQPVPAAEAPEAARAWLASRCD